MMHTRVCDILGIEKPIFQGAMAWISEARLAAAVSEAGGLGIIAAGSAPVEWVEEQIDLARTLTSKPICVNVMLMSPLAAEVAELLATKRVEVITTGAGTPVKYMPAWKDAGCKVVPVIASTAQAKRMESAGADAVVAEGSEAGGHIGELNTMALVPQVVEATSIPVLAAGGIADGRGMAAAIMLGAEGVQVGTRFLVAEECRVTEEYKARVMKATDADTIVIGRSVGHPIRGIKNGYARKVKAEEKNMNGQDFMAAFSGSVREGVMGDANAGALLAGQVAGLVDHEETAAGIVDDIVGGASLLLGKSEEELLERNATRDLRGIK